MIRISQSYRLKPMKDHKKKTIAKLAKDKSSQHRRAIRIYTLTKVQFPDTLPKGHCSKNSSVKSLHID